MKLTQDENKDDAEELNSICRGNFGTNSWVAPDRRTTFLARTLRAHVPMPARNLLNTKLLKDIKTTSSSVHNRNQKNGKAKNNNTNTVLVRKPISDSCFTKMKVCEESTKELPATLVNFALSIQRL